jgi:hypothetical protein
MSAVPAGGDGDDDDAGSGDQRMTADRQETKFLVAAAQVDLLVARLNQHLPHHRFRGPGANLLPAAQHFVTTVYFDTPSRAHHRAARRGAALASDVKIRAKEYYDLHPGLVELATDPSKIVRYQPTLWFELKRRQGTQTTKHRFRLAKQEVPALFGGGHLALDGLSRLAAPPQAEELGHVLRHCRALGEPLAADCLVNYRRLPWQDEEGTLRVTLDLDLAVYAPPADLWDRRRPLLRGTLGPPRLLRGDAVLEVKLRGVVPDWLQHLLVRVGARPAAFSKFALATEAVHGEEGSLGLP